MAEFNRKVFNGATELEWKKGEVFKPINGHTFISNYARVVSLNKSGYFKELKPIVTKRGTMQIGIREYFEYRGPNRRCYQLARLVLTHFVGGYRKQRRVRYIDGDKTNCALSNIEWMDGFQNGIDFDYLKGLNDKNLEEGDLIVKEVLLNKKEWLLLSYVKEMEGFLLKILREDFGFICPVDKLIDEVYKDTLAKINSAQFIPLSIRSKKYKALGYDKMKGDRLLRFARVRAFDFLNSYNPLRETTVLITRGGCSYNYSPTSETKHIAPDISSEIADMFNDLTV